jgi:drug/metabolite transporter (DMT)-like permease
MLKGFMKFLFHPYALLILTCWMWAGNAVASKMAIGHISPLVLTTLRWIISVSLMLMIAWQPLQKDWPVLKANWRKMLVYGFFGFTAFNVLMYLAANFTVAVNIGILQGAMPLFVLAGTVVLHKANTTPVQWLGLCITLVGVVVVASKGELATLLNLAFNKGDILMITACGLYSYYTILLKTRPQVHGLSFFTVAAVFALICSVPFLGVEIAMGQAIWPSSFKGWGILIYVALFPSLLSQLTFLKAVDMVGPGRAGIFVNLMPIFTPILAVLILNETFGLYHLFGLIFVLGGVGLAEWGKPKG